jgi:hypothetical protein
MGREPNVGSHPGKAWGLRGRCNRAPPQVPLVEPFTKDEDTSSETMSYISTYSYVTMVTFPFVLNEPHVLWLCAKLVYNSAFS